MQHLSISLKLTMGVVIALALVFFMGAVGYKALHDTHLLARADADAAARIQTALEADAALEGLPVLARDVVLSRSPSDVTAAVARVAPSVSVITERLYRLADQEPVPERADALLGAVQRVNAYAKALERLAERQTEVLHLRDTLLPQRRAAVDAALLPYRAPGGPVLQPLDAGLASVERDLLSLLAAGDISRGERALATLRALVTAVRAAEFAADATAQAKLIGDVETLARTLAEAIRQSQELVTIERDSAEPNRLRAQTALRTIKAALTADADLGRAEAAARANRAGQQMIGFGVAVALVLLFSIIL
ncbi:MAG: hypothetical protein ACOVKO_02645 [Elstera sp.]